MADAKPLKRASGKTKQFASTDTVPKANLGTGAGTSGTLFLADDQTWKAPNVTEIAESSLTNNSGAATDTTVAATADRIYNYFTLPTTYKFYVITGIEWKNGTTVAGNTQCGIHLVDSVSSPSAAIVLAAVGQNVANSGSAAVQRVSMVSPTIFRGGQTIGVFLQCDSTSHQYRTATVSSIKMRKGVTYTVSPNTQDITSWTNKTEQPYCKIYFTAY